jgi:predicted XRE-type DNA-binding protein
MKQVTKKRFASVWDAIEGTAEKAENLKLRSSLMITLKKHLAGTGLNRAQIAEPALHILASQVLCAERSTYLVWMRL